ncbi:hypothetical protein GCM10022290_04190 [Sagittula marina]
MLRPLRTLLNDHIKLTPGTRNKRPASTLRWLTARKPRATHFLPKIEISVKRRILDRQEKATPVRCSPIDIQCRITFALFRPPKSANQIVFRRFRPSPKA